MKLPTLLAAGALALAAYGSPLAAAQVSAIRLALRPGLAPAGVTASARFEHQPGRAVGAGGTFGLADSELSLTAVTGSVAATAWRGERMHLVASLEAGQRWLGGTTTRPRQGGPLPAQVSDLGIGLAFEAEVRDNLEFVAQLGLRSASDQPFASWEEVDGRAEAYLRWQHNDDHGILFGLNWGFRSRVLGGAPLPVVGWHYTPDRDLDLFVGLPGLSLRWVPFDRVMVFAAAFPGRYDASVSWRPIGRDGPFWLQGTAVGAFVRNQGWAARLRDRGSEAETLALREWQAGVRLFQGFDRQGGGFGLVAGWAFQRSLAEGEGANRAWGRDDDEVTVRRLAAGPFLAASLGLNF